MAEAPRRPNPLKLNPLQLKTLALLQAIAATPGLAEDEDGEGRVALRRLPHPHGDHFHIGSAVVATRDASGLTNPAVFGALERKGLVAAAGDAPALTRAGRDYPTGLAETLLHKTDH